MHQIEAQVCNVIVGAGVQNLTDHTANLCTIEAHFEGQKQGQGTKLLQTSREVFHFCLLKLIAAINCVTNTQSHHKGLLSMHAVLHVKRLLHGVRSVGRQCAARSRLQS